MKACYIHSAVSISSQDTFDATSFLTHPIQHSSKKAEAIHPNYKDHISPAALRRMATGVKMGVTAANKALEKANLEYIDAILTGTGIGCIEDTEKFLNAIIKNNEEFLTPTSFIQSTHNTVGAQIALGLKCKSYNNTFVHGSLSFESALMDAQLLINDDEATSVLVGGYDELGQEFIDYVQLLEDQTNNGIKVPMSEGASFFVLSSHEQPNAIKLLDLEMMSRCNTSDITSKLTDLLSKNKLQLDAIDAVIFGNNGDTYDAYYKEASALFSKSHHLTYKHLCGEFFTSSAFGLFIATQIIESQDIPSALVSKKGDSKPLKTVLLYNQFKGRNHSFILLQK